MIVEKVSDGRLVITGDDGDMRLPSNQSVTLAGYVDDIKGLIASSTVALAPLWSGGGTRLKILEAMAIGTPVVATSKGAEGLDAQTGEHLFVTDEPGEFAETIIKLLTDQNLRQRLAANASRLVREKYDWAVVMPGFLDLLRRVASI